MRWLLTLIVLMLASIASAQDHPVFFSSVAQKAVRAQMKADYEADADCTTSPTTMSNPATCTPATYGGKMYQYAHDTSASDFKYGDYGQFGAFMYRVCKDAGDDDAICNPYLEQAYGNITAVFLGMTFPGSCANNDRIMLGLMTLNYDWLYDGLSAERRTALLGKMKELVNGCVTGTAFSSGGDSDVVVGQYFGMAMLQCATGGYDSTVNGYWTDAARKIGGYAATAADNTNRRNMIKKYIETYAAGGSWIESEHYNMETVQYLLTYGEAVRSCRGSDDYPEVTAWVPEFAEGYMSLVSPGLSGVTSQPYQWSDEESPRNLRNYYRWEAGAQAAAQMQGTAAGERIQDWVLDYIDSVPNGIGLWTGPMAQTGISPYPLRAFMFFNPYATRGDHTTSVTYKFAPYVGLMLKRTNWTDGHFIGAMYSPPYYVHHVPYIFGEFQWWKGTGSTGEWIITHPVAYGGPAADQRGTNGLILQGLSYSSTFQYGAAQYRKIRAEQDNSTHGFTYITGTNGGAPCLPSQGCYGQPDPFIMEHTRSIVFVPGVESLIIFDRANVKDPATVAYYTGYTSTERTYMESQPRKSARFHMPVNPTIGSGFTSWPLTYQGNVRIDHVLPTAVTVTAENEAVVFGSPVAVSERKYHINVVPNVTQQWDTFLNVIQRYDSTPKTVTAVRDTSALVDGVLITSGTVNRLVAFNAIQGPDIPNCTRVGSTCTYNAGVDTILDTVRLRDASFSLTFTVAVGSTTKALLFDLDPNEAWTYTINAGAAEDLTVDADGVGVVDLTETGEVTLALTASGDLPVTIQTGSLPNGRKGSAYSQQLTSIGGAGSPTWDKTVGVFQTGLSISAGGLISGTPTVAESQTVTLRACDPSPNCGTREYTLIVADVPDITTTSLDDCALGAAYEDTVESTGGTAPRTITVQEGTLPTGLSLAGATGVISGTCTGALGLTELTFRVTDDAAATGDKELGITVVPALPVMTVQCQAGSNSAVCHYGIAGLDAADDCTLSLKEGETTIATSTTTEGLSRRTGTFTGLLANKTHGVDAVCGTAQADRAYFQTEPAPAVAGAGTYTLRLTPTARVLALMGAGGKAAVNWMAPGEESYTATKAVCTTSCTITLSDLASGNHTYYIAWETSGAAVVASSARRPAVVAIP